MNNRLDLTGRRKAAVFDLGEDFRGSSPAGETLSVNSYYLEKDGRPFFPVSGEIHYSRMAMDRWEDELIKIRLGGVNVVSTYLFWNHIEEEEGVFDFSGSRDLRRFVTLCRKHGLYVILRIGPFAHGEVRNGGLPDWLYAKPYQVRTTHPGFLQATKRLYTQIAGQVRGLFYADGGPIIAVQLDNEYMHSSAMWEMTTGISNEWVFKGDEGEKYVLALRDIALECGLKPVFFTGTAWGGAAYSPRVLPLWGGYAYRPWIFYSHAGEHPATEEYVYKDYHHSGGDMEGDFTPAYSPEERPYACCEMGAGMTCCYYYRFVYPCRSVDAMANIKLGSGCNFLGYYMYHGGTNPLGKHGVYQNEAQVPKRSYDYQAALGEFGQVRESYCRLKALHFFTRFFGDRLAPMETVLPEGASGIDPRDETTLRYAVRTDGESGFLFVNNFQDHLTLPARTGQQVTLRMEKETFDFRFSIASEENAVLPFGFDMDGIRLRQATAQPVLRTVLDGRVTYVFLAPEGMETVFTFEAGADVTGDLSAPRDGEVRLATVRKGSAEVDLLLLHREMANRLYMLRDGSLLFTDAALLEDEDGGLRLESTSPDCTLFCAPAHRLARAKGIARLENAGPLGRYQVQVPAQSVPFAVEEAAPFRWIISLPQAYPAGLKDVLLKIDYEGDIGSLFLKDTLIADNFCNGATWETGLREYLDQLAGQPLVLSIAPLRKGARVNVESAMAARNEEVADVIGTLKQVRLQPVYEIQL